jgi:hypothetical protein
MKRLGYIEQFIKRLNDDNKDFTIVINDYDDDDNIIVIDALYTTDYEQKVLSIRFEDDDLILFETLTELSKVGFQNNVKRLLNNYTRLLNDITRLSNYISE